MELRKKNLHMMQKKSEAQNQITFDEDYNVPDQKADIGQIIQKKGEVEIEQVQVSEGKAVIQGQLIFRLLYVADNPGKTVSSLEGKLPIEETLHLDKVQSGDKVCLKWEIEDLTIHLINSRKLNVKAIVEFLAVVDEEKQISIPVELKGEEEISAKKKTIRVLTLGVHKKDTLRLKEEVELVSNKPNIAELLWYTLEVRGLDLRPEENVVKAKGELFLFALYKGDDEDGTLQWLEHSIPFTGEVECSGCTFDMVPNLEASVINQSVEVKPDSDGEERIFVTDIVLELDIRLYREEDHEILMDVYTPFRQCIPKCKNEVLESLLVRNFSKCRVSDRIEIKETQGKILQICHSQGKVKIDKTKIVKDGIQVDGIVQMKVLYIVGNDDMPFYSMEVMMPFSHVVEARGITEDSVYYFHTDLEQLSTSMVDSNEIEVRAAVSLNVLVIQCIEEKIIESVEEQPLDTEKIRSMPGITVYMVKQGDTLWDIAKKFYTTMEEIISMNSLENDQLTLGQPLLLVKKVEI